MPESTRSDAQLTEAVEGLAEEKLRAWEREEEELRAARVGEHNTSKLVSARIPYLLLEDVRDFQAYLAGRLPPEAANTVNRTTALTVLLRWGLAKWRQEHGTTGG